MTRRHAVTDGHTDPLSGIVRVFLNSNLSVILILFSLIIGVAVLFITPREEDPQIVVPLADVYVQFPGHTAAEVEQLVSAPLERMLYQIDGVEYVYSMSRDDSAIITVRFYVGEDRERSLVKLFKKLNENADSITPGVTGWVMKPVEIDDVPIVTLAVKGANSDSFALRRVGEELVERLSMIEDVSRSFVVGGQSRTLTVQLDTEKLRSHQLTAVEVSRAVQGANTSVPAGSYTREDKSFNIETAGRITSAAQLSDVVVGVFDARPVFLKDVATVRDGADEVENYVRHGWGIARGFESHAGSPGSVVGEDSHQGHETNEHAASDTTSPNASQTAGLNAVELSPVQPHSDQNSLDSSLAATSVGETFIVGSEPTVTIAISKQKGANAVKVASRVIAEAERLKKEVLPDDVDLVITRNNGLTANHKVNELIEALGIAIVIVVLLLTVGLGWREAVIVSVAVPVVFGLTLAVNLLFGYTINRVTLFALILALGLLVDDPIVDVENIARHFAERKKASRAIVLDAVAEIRPPLISATLAVIVSFLPMFFITGMMGPYMSPMALNVPVAMLMSMIVAFTITPWLTYQMLKAHYPNEESNPELFAEGAANNPHLPASGGHQAAYDPEEIKKTLLYRFFRPLMVPLLKNRFRAISFLLFMGLLTAAAAGLGALRMVPLKMLPFDNKNEFLLVLDMPEGTSLERTDAVVQQIESKIAATPEVTDYTSYVGVAGPIDFNGMVRHYYLRGGAHQAEMRVNFVGKKNRKLQSHGLGLRMRDELTAIAQTAGGKIAIVELPPGPPVLASLVAEVTGQSDSEYSELLDAAATIGRRMEREPGVVEVDDISEASIAKLTFVPDQEKAALAGVSVAAIADTIRIALGGDNSQTIPVEHERTPLRLTFRLPRAARSSPDDLAQLPVKGASGEIVLLAELGKWVTTSASQTIYHKNLQRIAYVFAECAGRPPAECVIDLLADQQPAGPAFVADNEPTPTSSRTYLTNGSGIDWRVPAGINVNFAGEGEWKITLDVFRDLGLAFGAAMVMIYIILVAQTGSFVVPMIVMLAIPLTALGVMPGFYMLNAMLSSPVGGYPDPVFFTATAMIGMIALSGIVTRDSIILVDFMEQSVAAGRPLFDAILESRVVRLRPILLTAGAAMFSAIPITLDPIFSGLGWSLIFGLIASTLFTLFVIPATYWLIYHKRAAH